MSNIKAGDVVCLKSGGPDMTVESVSDNKITCIWTSENGFHQASIDADYLIRRKVTESVPTRAIL